MKRVKKEYSGLKAEMIDFGDYKMVTDGSLPSGCITIVADLVSENGEHNQYGSDQRCINPIDTTQFWYFNNRPAGWD